MNEKRRKILHIIFGVIAISSAIVTVLLTPFVKNLLKGDDKTEPTPPTTQIEYATTKLYTLFIYEKEYTLTRDSFNMTAIANDNSDVSMVITQHQKDYPTLCNEAATAYSFTDSAVKLNITAPYSVYSSTVGEGDEAVTTTVYCINCGDNDTVEIKIQLPANAQKHQERFDFFLSTFKIL